MDPNGFLINEYNPKWLYYSPEKWAELRKKHHCNDGCSNGKHDTSEGFLSEAEFLVQEYRKVCEAGAERNNQRIIEYDENERLERKKKKGKAPMV